MKSATIRLIKKNYLLIFILIVASVLRFYGLRWDSGFPTHPDERDVVMAASRVEFFSNLNPKFFTYGGLPIYLISAIAQLIGWEGNLFRLHIISRAFSALASLGSILLIYLIAKRLFGKTTGLVASILAAFSPGLIQYSHFGVADSLAIFLLLALLYFSLKLLEDRSIRPALLVGSILGLAIGTKIQSLIFGLIPTISLILSYRKRLFSKDFAKGVFIIFISSNFFFFVTNPFLLSEKNLFMKEVGDASAIARGQRITHFTLQFIGMDPFMFNIKNIFYLVGPVVVFGLLFFAWFFLLSKKKKDKRSLVFIIFPVIYFLYVNTWHAKFIRYMLPLTPFILIGASVVLIKLAKISKIFGNVILFGALIATVFYGLAFFNLYFSPMTTYTASEWIFENIPKDSKILTEALDLKLPLSVGGQDPSKYDVVELPMYEKDSPEKIETLVDNLVDTDYLIFSSPRFWANIPKDSKNYPVSARYYSAIFDGKLGLQKVAEFNKYPNLFGLQINDDKSEETFKVFDHPKVLIFKNFDRLQKKEMLFVLSHESDMF